MLYTINTINKTLKKRMLIVKQLKGSGSFLLEKKCIHHSKNVNISDLLTLPLVTYRKVKQGLKIVRTSRVISAHQYGKVVNVYNGIKFIPITITLNKINKKYRSFILNKRIGKTIHVKKKKTNK